MAGTKVKTARQGPGPLNLNPPGLSNAGREAVKDRAVAVRRGATLAQAFPSFESDMEKLAEYGLDAVCAQIENGTTAFQLARDIGVHQLVMRHYLNANSPRVSHSRMLAAVAWDELAEEEIRAAPDMFSLAKAQAMASHYRWRASKIAPKLYGDRLNVDAKVTHDVTGELARFISERKGLIPIIVDEDGSVVD